MSTIVYTLPVASTALIQEPKFEKLLGRLCSLSYSYESDESPDEIVVEEMIFEGVEAFRCTYYRAVSIDMFSAYDKLTVLAKSEWLDEIVTNLEANGGALPGLKHLRIYPDDGPCYEFVCLGFRIERNKQAASDASANRE
jgi:hypothetical protein